MNKQPLVCGMKLALWEALAERAAQGRLAARLEPEQDRCSVAIAPTASTP